MAVRDNWRAFWEAKFASTASNAEADRLASIADEELAILAKTELIEFLKVREGERVLDAGCGSGGTTMLMHPVARQIVAVDFSSAAIERARERGMDNVEWMVGDISETNLAERSFDRIVCLSVFHYLTDEQVRKCLASFSTLLKPGGELVLHVKNLASPYLASLQCAKWLRSCLKLKSGPVEHFRTWPWYFRELGRHGFEVCDFNSFNLLRVEGLPPSLVKGLQKWELRNYRKFPVSSRLFRLHGADLKIRSTLHQGPVDER
jgi:SAM-dependent methyltransferase